VRVEDAGGGTSVELQPLRYQFPDYKPRRGEMFDEWDANWLVIRGRVTTPDQTWSFTDPCLTVAEASELATWLRAVAAAEVLPPGAGRSGAIEFTEPNLSVTLGATEVDRRTLIWHFSQESSPPGADDETRFGDGHPVLTVVSADALARSADEWAQELAQFPQRGGS
jgi:hypothetical protein